MIIPNMLKRFLFATIFAITLIISLLACSAPARPTLPAPPFPLTVVIVDQPTLSAPRVQPTIPLLPPLSTPQSAARVKIFLIAIDDNGKAGKKIGCNDSVVPVDRSIPATQIANPANPSQRSRGLRPSGTTLAAALTELFSIHDRNYGQSGLYNALYQSTLKVDSATIASAKATVNLSGQVTLGGVCDNPRVKAQIEETARQFPTVNQVQVFVNNIPIDQVLSEKNSP